MEMTMIFTKDNAVHVREEERDQQRKRLYAAEKVLQGTTKRFANVGEMEAYVLRVSRYKVLQNRFGEHFLRNVAVKDGRGRSRAGGWAGGWAGGITMPLWSREELIVLHELAHTITMRLCGSGVAGHGWQYANVYLQLVKTVLGQEKHDILKASFKKHKVRTSPKAKRGPKEVTPEMIERLTKARETRLANLNEKKTLEAA
jgi:putative metallohydrolase (TIGR04338 family)